MAILTDKMSRKKKEAEEKLQYEILCIEMQRMWNMKFMITSVMTGATGIATKV